MIDLGKWNELPIVRFTDHGAYLDGGETGEILMPRQYVSPAMHPGDVVRVFVYLDQAERLVATTEQPLAQVGDFACLRVAWVNQYGAFLHWGLVKDLFVPFGEQKRRMELGHDYVVHVHVDPESRRIVGSAKIEHYLDSHPPLYPRGTEVDALIWQRTPLGFKAVVDNRYGGLIYGDRNYADLRVGDRVRAYVVQVRPDGKLDLSAEPLGTARFRDFAETLRQELREAGGFLPFTDKSDADAIADRFGVSKKTFKRAVGTLYRDRVIRIEPDGIALTGQKK